MHIEPFAVEIWMNEWETRCELNLAETCVESLKIGHLLDLAGQNEADLSALLDMKMTYGPIRGSARLRTAIAALYADRDPDTIITTHGTIGANMLVHQAMVERGDRVVAVIPTYQQHYSIPASIGAEVVPLKLREADGWLPDLDLLRDLAVPGTRMIALTNPNNPTGALIDRAMLEQIAGIARDVGAWVLVDEVYRGLDQDGPGMTASIADIYERGISTAGMSKAFSLAGLRLGWIAAPAEVIGKVSVHRDYSTISTGMIDEHIAAIALESRDRVLARARSITRDNLETLTGWMAGQPRLGWVRPRSGTTTLLRHDMALSSREMCVRLLEDTGVMLTPGDAFDMEGYVRIGFANPPAALSEGLARLSDWLVRQA